MHIPSDISLAEWIPWLIRKKKLYRFYMTDEWKTLRREVLRDAHNECQWCKEKSPSEIAEAETVHHLYEVKKYPKLALTRYIAGKQVLIPLCHDCHDKAHERFSYKKREADKFDERW